MFSSSLTVALYKAVKGGKVRDTTKNISFVNSVNERWRRIIRSDDPKQLWRAVNWSGTFDIPANSDNLPSDKVFCLHYDSLLNPPGNSTENIPETDIFIPVLDSDITPGEVDDQVKRLEQGSRL